MVSKAKVGKTRKVFAATILTAVFLVWFAEAGVAYAVTKSTDFMVGDKKVYATLSGDTSAVTGSTSYT